LTQPPNPIFKRSSLVTRVVERTFFHPGAQTLYRSASPQKYITSSESSERLVLLEIAPGQQCTYAIAPDGESRLITEGEGAGTPDAYSPEISIKEHRRWDVEPYNAMGWPRYHQTWTPNNGYNCPVFRGQSGVLIRIDEGTVEKLY